MEHSRSVFLIRTATILLTSLLFIQCGSEQEGKFDASPTAKVYELKGRVVSVDKGGKTASIAHEEIPGFMQPMTMDFEFKEDWVWDVLTVGAEVQADLVVDNVRGNSWLQNPRIVANAPGTAPAPKREDVAIEGRKIINFTLTNQDARPISSGDFLGKVWAVTFIYSECPLPDFCILMSKNFSDLANQIAVDDSLSGDVRLLSISFDPGRDTPARLKQYGLGYLGKDSNAKDFKIWQLAVGEESKIKPVADFFGLRYEVDKNDQTQFSHSLRTIVIGPDGTVRKVFAGNDWKPADLLEALKAARVPTATGR